MAENAHTSWEMPRVAGTRGGSLLFGRMFEDASIEQSIFPKGGRIFCIASAGCTAIELASTGYDVTAVDVNPAQIRYLRSRIAGHPAEQGSADRLLGLARRVLPMLGLGGNQLRHFLLLDDPEEQIHFWREHLGTRRLRGFARALLSPSMLRLLYASPLVRSLPDDFGGVLIARLERGFARHPNRSNPYMWRLATGGDPPGYPPPQPAVPLHLAIAEAAAYLASLPAGSFDGFTLSNILDGTDAAYEARLKEALRHAAAPGAVALLRSFGQPESAEEANLATADRSALWGRVTAIRFG